MADTATPAESGAVGAVAKSELAKAVAVVDANVAAGGENAEQSGSANGSVNGACEAQDAEKVLRMAKKQLEFYFGDYNLPRDKFLSATIKENEGGWVHVDTMLKFQRLAHITKDKALILKSLAASELLEVDEEKQSIRRLPSLTVPEVNEEWKKANVEKTVYCKGFEKEKTTLDDLIKFFETYDNVINVLKRTYIGPNKKDKLFKGSVFVTFKAKEDAEKFLKLGSVKNPQGEELVRKWQRDYFDEKDKEFEERRAKRQEQKKQTSKAKEVLAEASENAAAEEEGDKASGTESTKDGELPTGTILCLDGFKNGETKREDIKEALCSKVGLKNESIAFVYFDKGDKEAKLRLREGNAAKEVVEKLAPDGGKLTVNDDELQVSALEGQEESDFLQQCKEDIANQKRRNQVGRRGHKRRGGGGGQYRGGKRSRA